MYRVDRGETEGSSDARAAYLPLSIVQICFIVQTPIERMHNCTVWLHEE